MEHTRYIDELIDEYLLFRGFVKTFTTFSAEKATSAAGSSGSDRANGGGAGSGSGGSSAGGGGSSQSGAVTNVPTSVDALVSLLVSHVRAMDLDALQDCWAVMQSKFFVHLENATASRAGNAAAFSGGGAPAPTGGAPTLWSAQGTSLGTGITRAGVPAGSASSLTHALRSLEQSLKKALLVRCVQRGARTKLQECFDKLAAEMLAGSATGAHGHGSIGMHDASSSTDAAGSHGFPSAGNGWDGWFALLYLPSPETSPAFSAFFSKRWFATLVTSTHNLLSTVFRALPLPALLAFNIERERRRKNHAELRALRSELERTRIERDQAQIQLARLRSQGYRVFQRGVSQPAAFVAPTIPAAGGASLAAVPQTPQPNSNGVAASPTDALVSSAAAQWEAPSPSSAVASGIAVDVPSTGVAPSLDLPTPTSGAVPHARSSIAALEQMTASSDVFLLSSEPHVLLGHPGPVSKVRFNNEGSALLSMANNAALRAAIGGAANDHTTTLLAAAGAAGDDDALVEEFGNVPCRAVTRLWDVAALVEAGRERTEALLQQQEHAGNAGNIAPPPAATPRRASQRAAEPVTPAASSLLASPSTSLSHRGSYSAAAATATPFSSPLSTMHLPASSPQRTHAVSISPGRSSSASTASQNGFIASVTAAAAASSEDTDGWDGDGAFQQRALQPFGSIAHASLLASVAWSKSDTYILTGSATDGKVGVHKLLSRGGSGVQAPPQPTPSNGSDNGKSKSSKLLAEFVSPDAMLAGAASGSAQSQPAPGVACPVVLDLVTSPGDRFFVASWATSVACSGMRAGEGFTAGSKGSNGSTRVQPHLRGLLELWDLASGKRSTVFTLPSPSPAAMPGECTQINSLSLNHNGNMFVSGGADGMVRVWDTRASNAMAGWAAHSHEAGGVDGSSSGGGVACVRLCADETTLLSVGSDGSVVEWSLHRMGNVLRRVAAPPSPTPTVASMRSRGNSAVDPLSVAEYARPELALDGEARHTLLSGGLGWAASADTVVAPYHSAEQHVEDLDATVSAAYAALILALPPVPAASSAGSSGGSSGSAGPCPLQCLPLHAGPVLSVDWHPAADILATGAGDHTARIICGSTKYGL